VASALERYRTRGHLAVKGWLLQGAADALCELAGVQSRLGIRGPVCEIGVHHGRLFILLHLLAEPNERAVAIDLFDRQAENVDHSGEGDLALLLRNVERHGGDRGRLVILTENSLRLSAERILAQCGVPPRLFSIDGGHLAENACHDLALAHDTLCEGGIAILDDYFNPAWPGVSEGACRFMERHNRHLEPVAVTGNKFFMARGSAPAQAYREELARLHPHAKAMVFHGRPVLCFEDPSLADRFRCSPAWRSVRETGVGQVLRRARAWWRRARS
jgi:hypothetical protein